MVRTLFQFLVVALVATTLLGIAHTLVAAGCRRAAADIRGLQGDVNYERTFLSVAVCILPVHAHILACACTGLRRPGTRGHVLDGQAWAAFMVHLYWAVRLLLANQPPKHRDRNWDNIQAAVFDSPDLVSSPLFDVILTAWWTLDVLLRLGPLPGPRAGDAAAGAVGRCLTGHRGTRRPSRPPSCACSGSCSSLILFVVMAGRV